MRRMFAAEAAEFAELEPFRRLLLVLRRAVIAPLTFLASERDDVPHGRLFPAGELINRSIGESPTREFQTRQLTRGSPRLIPRPRCGRLRGSRTGRPARAPPPSSVRR